MSRLLTLPAAAPRSPKIDASPYAMRGYLTCTRFGVLTFVGALSAPFETADFDAIQCHEDDVAAIRAILRDGRPTPVVVAKRRILKETRPVLLTRP
jgi:hypothetical protein